MKKLVLAALAVLIVIGMLYSGLSNQLEKGLTADAKQHLSAISAEQSHHLIRLYNDSHRDILALYDWPGLSAELELFYASGESADPMTLRHTLSQFAERYGYTKVLLFDRQQRLAMWLDTSHVMLAGVYDKEALLGDLEHSLISAVERLQASVTPFYPSLEDLHQQGVLFSDVAALRESFLVAPLIAQQQLVGSIALGRRANDFGLLNPSKMRFGDSGQVVFIERGSESAFGLQFPHDASGQPKIVAADLSDTSSQLVRVLDDASGTAFFADSQGQSQLGQWRYIPEYRMGVMVYQSSDEIYAELGKFHLLALFAFFFTLIVTLSVGWGYVALLYDRVKRVNKKLAKMTHFIESDEGRNAPTFVLLDNLLGRVESRLQKDNDVLLSTKQRLRFFMKELEDQRFAFDQHCIILVADADGTFTDANLQFSDLSGYSRSELIGTKFERLGGDYQNTRIMQDIFKAMYAGEVWQGELNLVKRGGDRYWLETTFVPFVNEDGSLRNMVAIHTDITEQKLAYADMIHQAQYDSLTGLPNRALLLDRLGQMLRNAKRNTTQVAVLFLDLDDFKKINDSLGHELGDELLVEVGRRLKMLVRNQDTIGRLGGDEFLVLLDGPEYREDAEIVARKIIDSIQKPIVIDEYELVVGVSIGIAIYPDDGETESEMLRNADSAMYNAKNMGRNSWSYFTEAMNREVARRLEIESWMNGAIERGEFSVVFQPIVSVMSGKFATVEALVRWTHPQGGSISPEEFIPIAEHSGYIINIGRFVLEQSLDLAALWHQRYGTDLILALNASPRQFRDPNWHGGIEEQLAARGLTTRNLEFEITEGVLISGHENVERALQEFSDLGIAISMDDFGTGYSSLSYLRNYPFDTLKIDRSFVADIVEDHADYELVSAAIAMAHGLGLEVVAEGVETIEQYELLYHRRCDYAQGYLFSPPVSGAEILAMGGRLSVDSRIRQQRMTSEKRLPSKHQKGGAE